MQMPEKQKRRNRQEWLELIQECKRSDLSNRAWCHENGIPTSTFYKRIRQLRKQGYEIPATKREADVQSQQVVPWQIVDENKKASPANHVEENRPAVVVTSGRFHVGIHNHADGETIQKTLLALQQIC